MSTSQEKSNVIMMLAPDTTVVSDSEDEEVIDLKAVARKAAEMLERDLADMKVWNDEISWKKQEQADWRAAAKKKQEGEEVVEAQRKVDEDAKKKGSVQPPVSFACFLQ